MARDERIRLEVEAALFSAGDPVSVEALAETAGADEPAIRDALEALRTDYAERTTALQVSQAGEKWTMQVQTDYAEQVRDLAPMEVPDKTLKTLALVAYHQPILQSDLQTMVGSRVYDHVRELADLGLVTKRRHERTYELRTTEKFPEYFGLETTDPEEIRTSLAEAAGVPLPEPGEGAGGDGEAGPAGGEDASATDPGDAEDPSAPTAGGEGSADGAPEGGEPEETPLDVAGDGGAPGEAEGEEGAEPVEAVAAEDA